MKKEPLFKHHQGQPCCVFLGRFAYKEVINNIPALKHVVDLWYCGGLSELTMRHGNDVHAYDSHDVGFLRTNLSKLALSSARSEMAYTEAFIRARARGLIK